MVVSRVVIALGMASTLSGCLDCAIEAHVGDFFDDHDALDCKFAYRTFMTSGELVGSEEVQGCILDAIASRRAFVGGYLLAGIDSTLTYAFLGTADGEFELLEEYWFGTRRLRQTKCLTLTPSDDLVETIGLRCGGMNLETVCEE